MPRVHENNRIPLIHIKSKEGGYRSSIKSKKTGFHGPNILKAFQIIAVMHTHLYKRRRVAFRCPPPRGH